MEWIVVQVNQLGDAIVYSGSNVLAFVWLIKYFTHLDVLTSYDLFLVMSGNTKLLFMFCLCNNKIRPGNWSIGIAKHLSQTKNELQSVQPSTIDILYQLLYFKQLFLGHCLKNKALDFSLSSKMVN